MPPSFRAFEKTVAAGAQESFTVDFKPDSWVVSTADIWTGRIACYPSASVPGGAAFVLPSAGSANIPGLGERVLTIRNDSSAAISFNVIAARDIPVGGISFLPSGASVGGTGDLVIALDVKSIGTAGGTFTNGAWRTRDLTVLAVDTGSIASLSSNQLSLPPGAYRVLFGRTPARSVDEHQCRLQDVTSGITLILGSSAYLQSGINGVSESFLAGRFVLSSPSLIEVQHRCVTSRASDGFGVRSGFVSEVYTEIVLLKEA